MARSTVIRFAAGTPDAPFSCVWRLVVGKNNVYLGAGKASMGLLKISLHESGVWTLAATEQSGILLKEGNRRAKQWTRPAPHAQGVHLGPTIVAPYTSRGAHRLMPEDIKKKISWFPAPPVGHGVEFTLYFCDPQTNPSWDPEHTVIDCARLKSGSTVSVLARVRQLPAAYQATVESLLESSVFRFKDPSDFIGGSLLWIAETPDDRKTPFITDLPAPIAAK